jgi:crossover junction endodeoxyribonuclease RuvC
MSDMYPNAIVFIEKVSSMPKQGVASMFKFGRTVGALQAMLAAFKRRFQEVTPQAWQKVMHEGVNKKSMPNPKQRSVIVVKRLFPNENLLASARCKKPHEGFVDALLIAEYGRRVLSGKQK